MVVADGKQFRVLGRDKETYWNISGIQYYNHHEQVAEYLSGDPWKSYGVGGLELKLIKGGKGGTDEDENGGQ